MHSSDTRPGKENDLMIFRRKFLLAIAAFGRGRKIIADGILYQERLRSPRGKAFQE